MQNLIKCLGDIKCIALKSGCQQWNGKHENNTGGQRKCQRCLVKLPLIKDSKILLILGRRLIGRYLPGSDLSPSFLKTSTIDEDYQQEGKQDSAKHLLYSSARTG